MLQRLIAAVLGVLGLAAIGLGVASATIWRPDDTLLVTAPAADSGTLVVTAPGVLELGGAPVTVTARATGGTKVVLALGREVDVMGWVGTDAHTMLTGLADRSTLVTEAVAAAPTEAATDTATEADPAAAPDPEGSDMWVQQATGATTAELAWTPQAGRWTLLAAGVGDAAAAPSVVLSWPQTVTTPWLVPGVAAGTLLLLLGLVLGARLWLQARRGNAAVPLRAATGPTPVVAGGFRVDGAPGDLHGADDAPTMILTRRQMREAAAAAPAPRSPARMTLHWRGAPAAGDQAAPRTGDVEAVETRGEDTPAVLTSMTAAPTAPIRPAPAPVNPGATDSADPPSRPKFGRAGWTPRRPGRSAAAASDPASTAVTPASGDVTPAGGAAAAGERVARPFERAPEPEPPAAPGSRADAWRRAWGFPGAAEPGSESAAANDPATDPPDDPATASTTTDGADRPERSGSAVDDGPGSGPARRGSNS